MNIDDAFLYDLKYGDLSAKFIDNVFCVTEDTYMNEEAVKVVTRFHGHIFQGSKTSI